MKKWFFLVVWVMSVTSTAVVAQSLTLENMNNEFKADNLRHVTPIGTADQYACVSDDARQIVQYSFNGGKQTAVLLDVANTQGAHIDRVDGFVASTDGQKLLIQTNTEAVYRRSFKADYYIYTVRTRKLERLSDGGKQQSPVFSPDGNQVAFVRDNNIHLVKLLYDNAESQVTKDGKKGEIINGIPDWVNEEEFSFSTALCFNADGTKICWIRYDESMVPTYTLQQFNTLEENFEYKYPMAGQANSRVTLWSYDIQSHRTQQLQLPTADDDYIPRIVATADPDRIVCYTLNRAHSCLSIYSVNPSTTLSQLIVQEKTDKFIPERVIPQIKVVSSVILLPSDRSGYMHLYVYNMNGQLLREVGEGAEMVTSVYGYNPATDDVYCQIAPNAFDRFVAVSHKNGKTEAVTDREGWNEATFSPDMAYFVNTWSEKNTPYVVTTRSAKGKVIATIYDNSSLLARAKNHSWNRREFFSFTTSEGVSLNGWMVRPEGFSQSTRYPVVLYQYSGPGSQEVVNSWRTGSMGQAYDYYLAQEGYLVVCVDPRGTAGRGAEFEKQTYQHLGAMESKDLVETAQWLASQSYVDKDRIGIWGWSYGGFATLMAMSEGRQVFACGVAVAPVTCWRFYDTIYTERFMRTPQENTDGYALSPISRASSLSGTLLLCHGLMDDNVHPQNTFEYTDALVAADKDYREVIYTNRNHSIIGDNAREHLMRQITNFFDFHLKK